jgi:uncharacterized membrane protein
MYAYHILNMYAENKSSLDFLTVHLIHNSSRQQYWFDNT